VYRVTLDTNIYISALEFGGNPLRQNVIAMHSAKKAAQRSESWPVVLCLGLGAVMSAAA
jgi:hypothetical protein